MLLPISDAISEDSDITSKTDRKEIKRILIVDDDEQIREVLTDLLTIDGYEITSCEDGKSALEKIESHDFELMITDLGMPGMSGLELSGIVHEQNPDLPIAMITGWGTQLNKDEVALKGIKAVISKPFHLKDIKLMISGMV
jgi:two-component system cell cycle response regulator CpdR